jgi:sulfite exporter TauE/SafE
MIHWSALVLGFLGSMHCVGMCGPIALALPISRHNKFTVFIGSMLYNLGRITTYFIIGLIFGLIGKGFLIIGFQNFLSIFIGILILIFVFIKTRRVYSMKLLYFLNKPIGLLKFYITMLFGKKSNTTLYLIGILNGFLPCGFVYLALLGAFSTLNSFSGGLFMVFFGLGTLPAMLFLNIIAGLISNGFRKYIFKISDYVIVSMAIILILRGMNLGIPLISPGIQEIQLNGYDKQQIIIVPDCCLKNNDCNKN